MNINNLPVESGNYINGNDVTENLVDILKEKGSTATALRLDSSNALNNQPAKTGNMVSSNNEVYNIVDLIKSINITGGDITADMVTTSDGSTVQDDLTSIKTDVTSIEGTLEGYDNRITTNENDLNELGSQVSSIQSEVNSLAHSYKIFIGVPDSLTLTTDWQNLPLSTTTQIPEANTDFTITNSEITCTKSGNIHFKIIISLSEFSGGNIEQTFAINTVPTTTAQVYEQEAGVFTIVNDFYTPVVTNDKISILVKETQAMGGSLTFDSVLVFIEYL